MNIFDKQYTPRNEVDKETLKKKVFEYCCFEEYENKEYKGNNKDEDIHPDCLPAWETFKKADFDLDRFFLDDYYLLIDDDILRTSMIVGCLYLIEPVSKYVNGFMDCYLDFGLGLIEKNEAIKCGKDNHPVCDYDIFKYLYFCRTDEEIWDLLSLGFGEVESLFLWYMGIDTCPTYTVLCNSTFRGKKDEVKAKRLLDYVLTESSYTTEKVRTEILKQMMYDDLTLYIKCKEEGIKRYKKRAEIKRVDSLWDSWRLFYLSDREYAVKCQTKAVEMAKSIFEDDDLEEEFDL